MRQNVSGGRRIILTPVGRTGTENQGKESTSERYLKHLEVGKDKDGAGMISEVVVETLEQTEKLNPPRLSVEEVPEKSETIPSSSVHPPEPSCSKEPNSSRPGSSKQPSPVHSDSSDEEREGNTSDMVCLDVTGAVEMFLKTCSGVLPKDEFLSVERKLHKYLNQISKQFLTSIRLKNYIEMKWGLLDSDHKNVYIQIKDVLDEIKTYRRDGRSGTTSDLSDSNTTKKKVAVTTLYHPLRKVPDEIKDIEDVEEKELDDEDIISILELRPSKSSVPNPPGSSKPKPSQSFNPNLIERAKSPIAAGTSAGPPVTENPPGGKKKVVSKKHKRKLEKALLQCEKQIRKLEETEVDFDQDDNSVYILEAKYVLLLKILRFQ